MNKEKILQKSDDFSNIISTGQKIKNKYFSLYYKESNKVHYGITVPKKIGHAVIRNKLKRQTREIIDRLKTLFKNEKDYIIMIRKGCINTTFKEKLENLEKKLKEEIWKIKKLLYY